MTKVQYEGDIPTGWGSLSGQEESDRFWWGASMGVNVGHSETLLRPNVTTDDDQPLWWAKGGTLIGGSPARIKWMRSFWEGTSKREAGDGKYDDAAACPRNLYVCTDVSWCARTRACVRMSVCCTYMHMCYKILDII